MTSLSQYGVVVRKPSAESVYDSFDELGVQRNRKNSEFPCFANSEVRLRSFDTWPIGMPVKPKTLCDAGFYYTGRGD